MHIPTESQQNDVVGRLISIVIPVFNEENNVDLAYDAVVQVFEALRPRYRYEIIFTDDHSTDRTFEVLRKLAARDPAVRVLRFARNFGINKAILTGYRYARGEAAIELDCDLQDPPSLIPTFLVKWEDGHDVVVGIRDSREESRLMETLRRLYYRLLVTVADEPLIADAGEFRLVDRRILDQLQSIDDARPFVRGLVSSLSARQTGIPYRRGSRRYDKSKFPIHRLVPLAIDGLISHSVLPLRLATLAGLIVAFIATSISFYYMLARFLFGSDWPSGFATTTILILFGISLNALFLGIIGEYVGRIYLQVRRRPTTIIERAINCDTIDTQVRAES
jgi:polyisoprenyl-phosphate glycosyltransferase